MSTTHETAEIRVRPLGRGTFVGGIVVTVALHAALAWLVYYAHTRTPPPAPVVHDVMVTRIITLGKKRDKFLLPRIVEPPKPKAPPATVKVSEDLAAPPAVKPPPRPPDPEPSKDLKRALDRARALARSTAAEEPPEGLETGSELGNSSTASEGDAYATQVRELVRRHWSVPAGLTVGDIQNLEAEIRISISSDGTIREPTMRRSSGNQLYDSSCIEAIQATQKVPPPPAGYRKGFVLVLGGKDLAP